jgi:aspartate/methionine/tyrosine aminotransferase
MEIRDFALERYFARHEFTARYLLSASDCETLPQADLVALAGPRELGLWEHLTLGYTESEGHPLLRQEIAQLYRSIRPEEVLVAAPEEGIFLAMQAVLRPGDRVVVTWPAYQSLYEIAAAMGCVVERWQLREAASGWDLDLEALARLLEREIKLVVVNFPHNPTGFLPAKEQWSAILNMVAQSGAHLLSDEMYRMLEPDPVLRLIPACDLYENAITLSGLSKAFGLPGLRIGWLATRDVGLRRRLARIKDYTTICSSAPSEILGIMALRATDGIVERNRKIVQANTALTKAFMSRHPDQFQWLAPIAGSVCFPRWTGGTPVDAMCASALAEAGVVLTPGSLFEAPGGYLRLGLGRRSYPEALHVFEDWLGHRKQG